MTPFSLQISLILLGTVALVAPLLTAAFYRPYNIFHPLNFIALSLFFGVFGRLLFILLSSSTLIPELLDSRPIESLLPGAFLSALGSCLLCGGYVACGNAQFKAASLSKALKAYRFENLLPLLPVFFFVGLIALVLFLRATGFQYSGLSSLSEKRRVIINDVESSMGYLRFLAQDLPRVLLLLLVAKLALGDRRTSSLLWIATGCFAFLTLSVPFLASSRANVLLTLITVCVVVHRIRGLSLFSVLAAVALATIVIFGMLAMRRVHTRQMALTDAITESGLEPLFANHTFADVVKLAHIYEAVPDLIPYKYGSSFLSIFFAPIPRSIWPDKPPVAMGREITEKIYHKGLTLKKKGGGTPPGLFGETIVNFGVWGFPFAILLFGALLRLIQNTVWKLSEQSEAGVALYGAVVPMYCLNMMGGDYTRALMQSLIVMTLVVTYCLISRFEIRGVKGN